MNGHLLRQFLAVVMICLGLSSSAWAQSAFIHVGEESFPCPKGPGFQLLSVYFHAAGPVHTARFKVVASSPVTILDPPGGEFNVTLSPCRSDWAFGTLVVIVPAGSTVQFTVVPATGHAEIELTDCDGYALRTVSQCDLAQLIGPYRPNPPDGATVVPTNQLLSYVGRANTVVIGTTPDLHNAQVICNSGQYASCVLPIDPGPLAPNTTYYWQAHDYCVCGQVIDGHSDVFSFTTGDAPLALEPSTWGRVKAMYRD